jgi:hypothetical protein
MTVLDVRPHLPPFAFNRTQHLGIISKTPVPKFDASSTWSLIPALNSSTAQEETATTRHRYKGVAGREDIPPEDEPTWAEARSLRSSSPVSKSSK